MRLMYYSANWQLLEEHIDRAWSGSGFTEDEKAQNFWGKRYIDDAVARRRDRGVSAGYEDTFFYLTDAQFSDVAMVQASNARVVERTTYDSYGKARHHFGGDVDNDGAATTADDNAIVATINGGNNSIGQSGYVAEQDLNRDGVIDYNDRLTLQALTGNTAQPALASGYVSFESTGTGSSQRFGPDNPIAWDGYVFNPETLQYTVRFRWYDPVLGRWLERDPVGYLAGQNLYGYVLDSPVSRRDPLGLFPDPGLPEGACCNMWPDDCDTQVFTMFGRMAQQLESELTALASEAYSLSKTPPDEIPDGYREHIDAEIAHRQQLWQELEDAFEALGCNRGATGPVYKYDEVYYRNYEGTLAGAMRAVDEIEQQLWHGGDRMADPLFLDLVSIFFPAGGAAIVPVRMRAAETVAQCTLNRARGEVFQEGVHRATGLLRNTKRLILPSGRYRIPDVLDRAAKIVGDAKCIKKAFATAQIRDLASWARANGYTCKLWLPSGTPISKPLQRLVDEGLIIIEHPRI